MKSGRRILHWNSPLPASVHRRHEHPSTSDNFGAIDRAADEPIGPDGVRTNDCNGQAYYCKRLGRWVACGAHWRTPGPNGYTRIKRRGLPGTRRMTEAELHRTNWDWDQVRRWRRPNGERPRTIEELYAYGVLHGVIQIVEEKHPQFATVALMAEQVAAARRHDHPAWYMVLEDMAPREKVHATREAGGRIGLIFGTKAVTKPPNWGYWPAYPDQIWGPDYARRWLPA